MCLLSGYLCWTNAHDQDYADEQYLFCDFYLKDEMNLSLTIQANELLADCQ